MTIKNFIITGPLSEEQSKFISGVEESLALTMTNPGGHFYDSVDIKKYKSLLSKESKKFKKSFTESSGLFTFQTDHYHIQMALENAFKHPVDSICSFEFSPEVFRFAFLHEIAIHTYKCKELRAIYPIHIRVMTVWLLVTYFNIRNFKTEDFKRAFDVAEECLNEDFAVVENIWNEMHRWREENDEAIRRWQEEMNYARRVMRKAKRIATNKYQGKDLEICNFMARDNTIFTYNEIISDTCKHFNLSRKTVLKRAKELDFDEKLYSELHNNGELYLVMEEKRRLWYEKILATGPYDKHTAKKIYYQRFNRFRTFGSMISPYTEEEVLEQSREIAEDDKIILPIPPIISQVGKPMNTSECSQLFDCFDEATLEEAPKEVLLRNIYGYRMLSITPSDSNIKASKSVAESTSIPREFVDINDALDYIMS